MNEGDLASSLRSGILLTIPQHAGTWVQNSTQVPKARDAHTLIKHNVKTMLALTDGTLQQLLSGGAEWIHEQDYLSVTTHRAQSGE